LLALKILPVLAGIHYSSVLYTIRISMVLIAFVKIKRARPVPCVSFLSLVRIGNRISDMHAGRRANMR